MNTTEFKKYIFTEDVGLCFATKLNGKFQWEDSKRYEFNSVHVFKVSVDKYGSLDLTTPEGRLIPSVHSHLIREVHEEFEASPTKVLESFPDPVPGIPGPHPGSWYCPDTFNTLRVIPDHDVPSSLLDCSRPPVACPPVAYLALTQGTGRITPKLYYRCSFFGVPRNKV